MRSRVLLLTAASLLVSLAAVTAEATVLRVVVVETSDAAAYVKELERGKALMKKAGMTGQIRVWRARFAGQDAGAIAVGVEYSDLATFAAEDKKMQTDPELSAWLKGLDKLRKIVSDSVYD
ncbi:MAG TPA: hypothetical protein VKA01_08315, partial [Vicinamibacteria bacterium]|nr:hypothetical protein [Vicinamibacteria bacterium]